MVSNSRNRGTGHASELWPVLLLLAFVAIPTLGVLWFVGVAMENQRDASRQRLTDAYHVHLMSVQNSIEAEWRQLLANCPSRSTEPLASPQFARIAEHDIFDAAVLYDSQGQVVYPEPIVTRTTEWRSGAHWQDAIRTENDAQLPGDAAKLYAQIADNADSPVEYVDAIQGQVRCFMQIGETQAATDLVISHLNDEPFSHQQSQETQAIVANVELMTLEQDIAAEQRLRVIDSLSKRLLNRGQESLAASQRLFLMKRLSQISPSVIPSAILAAEELASQYSSIQPNLSANARLERTPIPGTWQVLAPDGLSVLLLRTESVRRFLIDAIPPQSQHTIIRPILPGAEDKNELAFQVLKASPTFDDWQLEMTLDDGTSIDDVAMQTSRLHLWTCALIVLFTCIFGFYLARAFRRQVRLANLKNDLVGTVTHELKTPLSSMRLLVDTLLAESTLDERTTREYLELIAKENVRLSRLIDNFLTFSRMEKGQHVMECQSVDIRKVVSDAVEASGDRLQPPQCHFSTELAGDLPEVAGDHEALVAVVMNLIDNAYKYSEEPREIHVSARSSDRSILIAVRDNGIGVSNASEKRIFDRFYQVDQTLGRQGQGCGMGLSIVEHIVGAHAGSISVKSRLGEGSTFTVTLPLADAKTPKHGAESVDSGQLEEQARS